LSFRSEIKETSSIVIQVQQNYLLESIFMNVRSWNLRCALLVSRARSATSRWGNQRRETPMKKLGIVLASLIAIAFIAPTLAAAGEMHRDRHVDRHHHDDHHKKHSLIKKLLH
jgi:hypothetical protein